MDEPIAVVRKRVSRAFLGRDGIHGVGSLPLEGVITVHAAAMSPESRTRLLRELTAMAKPFAVRLEHDQPPRANCQ